MTLTQTYEQHRDLLTQMDYKRGNTLVARRSYLYDTLGRPTSRTLARQGTTRNDVFHYNDRSESPRRLVGGLDKPRSAFAPQGRAGNGVPASQLISDVVDGTGLNGWDYDRAVAPPLQAAPAWQTAPRCSARWVPASP